MFRHFFSKDYEPQLLDTALNAIPDQVLLLAPDFTVVSYNEAVLKNIKVDAEDLHNLKCYEIFGQNDICNNCAVKKAINSLKEEKIEAYSSSMGIYLEAWATPILDENGEVKYIVEQIKDITRQKEKIYSLEKISEISEEFLQLPVGKIDYKMITDKLLELTGARMVIFNEYQSFEENVITMSVAGRSDENKKILDEMIGKKWIINSSKLDKIRKNKPVHFSDLNKAGEGFISNQMIEMLKRNLEGIIEEYEVYVIAIARDNIVIGDFVIFMPRGDELYYPEIVEIYADYVGITLIRDRAEKKLRENEVRLKKITEEYETIFQNTRDAIFIANVEEDGTFRYLRNNKSHQELTGVSLADFKGRTPDEVFDPETAKILKENYRCCLELKDNYMFEEELDFPGGKRAWLTLLSPVMENGKVKQIIGVRRDITDIKRAEKELSYQKEWLEAHFKNSTDGIVQLDKNNRVIDANHRFCEIFGYIKEEVRGVELYKLVIKKEDLEKGHKGYADLVMAGERYETEATRYNKWNEPIEVLIKIIPILIEGTIMGCYFIYSDITERKRAQEKLDKYARELEKLYEQLDREVSRAREFHERTLPKEFPHVEGISMDVFYKPAKRLGGDFYDIKRINNKLIFYISDVSGHGIDAAMLSSFIKDVVNDYTHVYSLENITPKNILEFMASRYQEEDYPDEYFITIFLGVLDLDDYTLKYKAMGMQDSPLVNFDDGSQVELVSKGLPITTTIPLELYDFEESEITLEKGATVFIATDGLTEKMCCNEYYVSRLPEVFSKFHRMPVYVIKEAVKRDFLDFSSDCGLEEGDDDITYLILKIEDEASTYSLKIESSLEELSGLHNKLINYFSYKGLDEELIMAIHELCANAVEHGNKLNPEKMVKAIITLEDEYTAAKIKDQGEGFDWESVLEKPPHILGAAERGRGIHLAKMNVDETYFNEKGNEVVIYKYKK